MTQNLYLGADKGAMMDPRRTRRPTIGKVTPACDSISAYARTHTVAIRRRYDRRNLAPPPPLITLSHMLVRILCRHLCRFSQNKFGIDVDSAR